MMPLPNQEFLESLIQKNKPHDPIVIIKFGATWCGPCKRLDMKLLTGLSDKIKWYDCDIDENDYTAGYCGVKTIPAFLAIVNGSAKPLFQSSDTQKVADWMKRGFQV
jgi:thioredoxin-like negative regulator of GroEL